MNGWCHVPWRPSTMAAAAGPMLYAGGFFSTSGGVTTNHIAKWDGSELVRTSEAASNLNDVNGPWWTSTTAAARGPALYVWRVGSCSSQVVVAAKATSRCGTAAGWSAAREAESRGSGMNGSVPCPHGLRRRHWAPCPLSTPAAVFSTSRLGRQLHRSAGVVLRPTSTTTFCTAKTALVCGPASIGATGAPSATATSGFVVRAQPVRGCRSGLLLYSNQPVQPGAAFGGPGNGLLCLLGTGLRRAGPMDSGGTSPLACDGILTIDVNQFQTNNWVAGGCNPPPGQNNPAGFLGNMGTTVRAQVWGRDSIATGQVLSDGVSWVVGP